MKCWECEHNDLAQSKEPCKSCLEKHQEENDEAAVKKVIYSCSDKQNDTIIKNIEELYFLPGMHIVDVTYGKGNFWNKINLKDYHFSGSDLKDGTDLRDTKHVKNSINVWVLDPPYAIKNSGQRKKLNDSYGLDNIKDTHDIMDLYYKGMLEAKRCLKRGGLLLLKCQDIKHGGMHFWNHVDFCNFAESIGFKAIDLFVLKNSINVPAYNQKSSRKNHSYMWVFKNKTGIK